MFGQRGIRRTDATEEILVSVVMRNVVIRDGRRRGCRRFVILACVQVQKKRKFEAVESWSKFRELENRHFIR